MRKILTYLALSLAAIAGVAASVALANHGGTPGTANDGKICAGGDSGKIDVAEGTGSVTITAPDGKLITGYCVKAGSENSGDGPVNVAVVPPAATVTFTYPGGKDISHYSFNWTTSTPGTTTETTPTETTPTETTPTETTPTETTPTETTPTTPSPPPPPPHNVTGQATVICDGNVYTISGTIDGQAVDSVSPATLPGTSKGTFNVVLQRGDTAFRTSVTVNGDCGPRPPATPNTGQAPTATPPPPPAPVSNPPQATSSTSATEKPKEQPKAPGTLTGDPKKDKCVPKGGGTAECVTSTGKKVTVTMGNG